MCLKHQGAKISLYLYLNRRMSHEAGLPASSGLLENLSGSHQALQEAIPQGDPPDPPANEHQSVLDSPSPAARLPPRQPPPSAQPNYTPSQNAILTSLKGENDLLQKQLASLANKCREQHQELMSLRQHAEKDLLSTKLEMQSRQQPGGIATDVGRSPPTCLLFGVGDDDHRIGQAEEAAGHTKELTAAKVEVLQLAEAHRALQSALERSQSQNVQLGSLLGLSVSDLALTVEGMTRVLDALEVLQKQLLPSFRPPGREGLLVAGAVSMQQGIPEPRLVHELTDRILQTIQTIQVGDVCLHSEDQRLTRQEEQVRSERESLRGQVEQLQSLYSKQIESLRTQVTTTTAHTIFR
ncbi:hypothetical protein PAPYR_7356 [Paratrimastix pyriformis]|uniref:Uncharacterized protein n=1 Tax=Paratrimastix pyriformis TaxID=342808 RepID=A0ABQ8UFJ4_9EUKA|nr:hypothetical protein PAPYR_7356 [Paratrimastix pyriformis]